MAQRLPRGSVVLADSGFGIFSVGYALVDAGHRILFRLAKSRFKALARQATEVERWAGQTTYRLRWTPSAKDRQCNPELPADATLDVLLHVVTAYNLVIQFVAKLRSWPTWYRGG